MPVQGADSTPALRGPQCDSGGDALLNLKPGVNTAKCHIPVNTLTFIYTNIRCLNKTSYVCIVNSRL